MSMIFLCTHPPTSSITPQSPTSVVRYAWLVTLGRTDVSLGRISCGAHTGKVRTDYIARLFSIAG